LKEEGVDFTSEGRIKERWRGEWDAFNVDV